ncbi:MAG: hypothetical protein EHM68_13660 [Lysobacterales bacterium]|nr:MAG: hypothetical protein EHM68_13660 [Xanthomonadales bacterium]
MMNHVNSAIDTESIPAHHVSSRVPAVAKSAAGLAVHYFREGELLKIGKSGEIDPRLVCLLQPTSLLAESYFRLRHTLEQMRNGKRGIVVGVTSPGEGDGKTFTAINLAGALAQDASARVLLVDLNLRQSGADLRSCFDMQPDADSGVSDWIGREAPGKGPASYHLPGLNLHLMPSGTSVESPYKLLTSARLDELFEQARRTYDFIIVDSPQTLRLPDIELIARVVDGFLVVVRADATPQEKLEEALNLMTQDKVLGLVFNGVPAQR